MNLNHSPRLACCMGNGTFRSVWPHGSRGSYLGAGLFSATKHFFTANTNPARIYDPLQNYDFFRDHYRIPYDTMAIAAMVQPHMSKQEMTAAEVNAVIQALTAAIKANEKFEKDVTDYYGTRVSRTSGGKRDRLRAERAAVRGESEKARKMAAATISDMRVMKIAEVKSQMKTDPDFVVSTTDPDSGGIVYTKSVPATNPKTGTVTFKPVSLSVIPAGAPAIGNAGGMGKWLLPVGAGLAAYFALKG